MTLRTSDESQQQQQQGRRAESRLTRKRKKELKNANTIITSAGNGKQQQGRLKEKKLQHSLGVSVRVYGCVCECVDQQCWSQHTHTPHTHSCTHPGQQVAPQPLTRTNIWQLPHPASSCRMLPAAAVLPLLLFVFWSMLSTGSHKCRASACACAPPFVLGSARSTTFPKKRPTERKNEAKTKKQQKKIGQRKVQTLQAGNKSQVAFAKNNKIYTDIYIRLHNTCCSLRWKIYIFFMKTKRGVAQQSKHTFLSTWNTQRVCKKRVR